MKKSIFLSLIAVLLLTAFTADSYSWFFSEQTVTSVFEHVIGIKTRIFNLDSENNAPIAGSVFELLDNDKNILGRYQTDKNGSALLQRISSGETFQIKQISSAYGYEVNDDVYKITPNKNELVIKSKKRPKNNTALKIKTAISQKAYQENDYIPSQAELDFPFEYTVNISDAATRLQYEIKNESGQLISPYTYKYENGQSIKVLSRGEMDNGGTIHLRSGEIAYFSFNDIKPLTEYNIIPKSYVDQTGQASYYLTSCHNSFGHIPVEGAAAEFTYHPFKDIPPVASALIVESKVENADSSNLNQEFLIELKIGDNAQKQYYYEIVDYLKSDSKPLLSQGNIIKAALNHSSFLKVYDIPLGLDYTISQQDSSADGYFVFSSNNTVGNTLSSQKAVVYNKRLFEKTKDIKLNISSQELNTENTAQSEEAFADLIDVKSGISYKSFNLTLTDGLNQNITLPVCDYVSKKKINYGIKLSLPHGYAVHSTDLSDEALSISYKNLCDSVNIGIRNIVNGISAPEERFTYNIEAATPGTPLPPFDTSTHLLGNGAAFFNAIKYMPKGINGKRTYKYYITQQPNNTKGFTYDQKTYELMVEVTEKDGYCIAEIIDIKGGSAFDGLLLFENQYIKDDSPELSRLIVRKIVEAKDIDFDERFNFIAKIGDEEHRFELSHGKTKVFDNIPIGAPYEIVEEKNDKYKTEGFGVEGKLEKEDSVAVFINTPIEKEPPNSGTLTIYKEIFSNEAEKNKKFRFTVTINGVKKQIYLRGGESITLDKLKEGSRYSVRESDYSEDGYKTFSFGSNGIINKTGNIALFFNVKKPVQRSFLSVTNEVWEGDREKQFDYTAEIGDEKYLFSLSDEESISFEDIPIDTPYTISQKDYSSEGYHTLAFSQSGVILPSGIKTVFVNIKSSDKTIDDVPSTESDTSSESNSLNTAESKEPSSKPSESKPELKENEVIINTNPPKNNMNKLDSNIVPYAFAASAVVISATWVCICNPNGVKCCLKKALNILKNIRKP